MYEIVMTSDAGCSRETRPLPDSACYRPTWRLFPHILGRTCNDLDILIRIRCIRKGKRTKEG